MEAPRSQLFRRGGRLPHAGTVARVRLVEADPDSMGLELEVRLARRAIEARARE
jgi:hypothetical protein